MEPKPTPSAEGTWYPLELESDRMGAQVRSFMSSLLNVGPAQPAPFGALWLSATEVAQGETFQLRVRLHPSGPLHLRDFSVMLVAEALVEWSPWATRRHEAELRRIRHSEIVMMHTNQVLRAGEVLELPLERVTVPPGDIDGDSSSRWYLKIEARLEDQKDLFLQQIPLRVRPRLQAGEPEPREHLPPLPKPRVEEERLLTTGAPVSVDVRRQLEGAIETLEAAHARYAFLEKLLRRKQWQQQVLARLDTLRELVRQEPEVDEALARLHQRARVEGWPETEPALVLAREVEGLRSRLEVLMSQQRVIPEAREGRLAERLTHLDRVLAQTIAPPITPEEKVLHQGEFLRPSRIPPLLMMIGALAAIASQQDEWQLVEVHLLMMGSSLVTPFLTSLREALQRRRSGRFWLTGKRLVWQPTKREPIHLPLHAIRPGGVRRLSNKSVEVRLVDGLTVRLEFIEGVTQLVTLLEQHRPAALQDESQQGM